MVCPWATWSVKSSYGLFLGHIQPAMFRVITGSNWRTRWSTWNGTWIAHMPARALPTVLSAPPLAFYFILFYFAVSWIQPKTSPMQGKSCTTSTQSHPIPGFMCPASPFALDCQLVRWPPQTVSSTYNVWYICDVSFGAAGWKDLTRVRACSPPWHDPQHHIGYPEHCQMWPQTLHAFPKVFLCKNRQ